MLQKYKVVKHCGTLKSAEYVYFYFILWDTKGESNYDCKYQIYVSLSAKTSQSQIYRWFSDCPEAQNSSLYC